MKKLGLRELLNVIAIVPFIFYCTIMGEIWRLSRRAVLEEPVQSSLLYISVFLLASVLMQGILHTIWLCCYYHEPDRKNRLITMLFMLLAAVGVFIFMMM